MRYLNCDSLIEIKGRINVYLYPCITIYFMNDIIILAKIIATRPLTNRDSQTIIRTDLKLVITALIFCSRVHKNLLTKTRLTYSKYLQAKN